MDSFSRMGFRGPKVVGLISICPNLKFDVLHSSLRSFFAFSASPHLISEGVIMRPKRFLIFIGALDRGSSGLREMVSYLFFGWVV